MTARRILIADDHAAVRRGIRALLEWHGEWTVCGEASDGNEAIEQARRFRPDVVLLDMTMPNLNGLQAVREIKRVAPAAQVLMLTMHASDQLAQEVRRAGAAGVIFKSQADESLIAAIESLPLAMSAIHLGSSVVDDRRHIAAFFASDGERDRVLSPFIAEGLTKGEKALHIIDPGERELHVHRLIEAGIDVDRAEAERRLEFLPWEKSTLRNGEFNRRAMLALIEQLFSDASAEGFPRMRFIGHMEWALQDLPGVNDLIAFESEVNHIVPNYPNVAVCAYDVTKFRGDVIVDAIRVHPAILIGGALHDNPFYAPRQRQPA